MADEVLDRFDEFLDALKAASANALASDFSKPPFYQIQPRGARWCEVKMKAGVTFEPTPHLRVFMRCVVVHHEVEVPVLGRLAINLA